MALFGCYHLFYDRWLYYGQPGDPFYFKMMTMHPKETNTDFEVRSLDSVCVNTSELIHPWWYNFKYLFFGTVFGIVLTKAEVISWFRIQEMFRLQSFTCTGL